MAKNENPENREDAPAIIDYEGASEANQSANEGNAFADCKRYWKKRLYQRFQLGGLVWTVSNQTNLSRLLKQFGIDEVKNMIDEWVVSKPIDYASKFNLFYKNRHILHERITPKEYDW